MRGTGGSSGLSLHELPASASERHCNSLVDPNSLACFDSYFPLHNPPPTCVCASARACMRGRACLCVCLCKCVS